MCAHTSLACFLSPLPSQPARFLGPWGQPRRAPPAPPARASGSSSAPGQPATPQSHVFRLRPPRPPPHPVQRLAQQWLSLHHRRRPSTPGPVQEPRHRLPDRVRRGHQRRPGCALPTSLGLPARVDPFLHRPPAPGGRVRAASAPAGPGQAPPGLGVDRADPDDVRRQTGPVGGAGRPGHAPGADLWRPLLLARRPGGVRGPAARVCARRRARGRLVPAAVARRTGSGRGRARLPGPPHPGTRPAGGARCLATRGFRPPVHRLRLLAAGPVPGRVAPPAPAVPERGGAGAVGLGGGVGGGGEGGG